MVSTLQTPIVVAIFLCAMGFENALKGVVLSINKFGMSKTPVPAIMIIANLLALVTGPVYVLWMLTTTDCQSMTLAMKLCMHSFFITFCKSAICVYQTLLTCWLIIQPSFSFTKHGSYPKNAKPLQSPHPFSS
ncbi:hypothetical protein BJ741DRAFT_596231 [Chytriomyces cf. hyalinus JEL632]|nr:hypothetical protein BJ741DRAFT_596231 [Chytriomyces cf. hyalinus JEL632]